MMPDIWLIDTRQNLDH